MGFWRKIVEAVSHEDGTGSMYAALIGVPSAFDPPPGAKPKQEIRPQQTRPAPPPRK